jgi:hypothetical protein
VPRRGLHGPVSSTLPAQFGMLWFHTATGSYQIGVGKRGKAEPMYLFDYAPETATYNIAPSGRASS